MAEGFTIAIEWCQVVQAVIEQTVRAAVGPRGSDAAPAS